MNDKAKTAAAVCTLEQLGYTYHGGEQWKPPLGKAPDFGLVNTLRDRIAELEAQIEAVGAGGVQRLSLQKPAPAHDNQAQAAINSGAQAVPVVWLSGKQLNGITAIHGSYLPFRHQREGLFDTPVYLEAAASQAAPAAQSDASAILSKVCDLFHIGKMARTESTILVNVENVIHHASLLRAVERDLFPQPELPEDDDPYAAVSDDLPVPNSWGAKDEADYVSQFRAALIAHGFTTPPPAAPQAAPAQELEPFAWFTDWHPDGRKYAEKPHGFNEPGVLLDDPDLIREVWQPLYTTPQAAPAVDERAAFEAWYCKQMAEAGYGPDCTIHELREENHYGEHRVMLNGKWEGWQARAAIAAAPHAAPVPPILAADHDGMRVDYSGLLGQCRRALKHREPANAEMLRQLQSHLRELGRRWYAGDTASVDEFLQLYCVEHAARTALATQGGAT